MQPPADVERQTHGWRSEKRLVVLESVPQFRQERFSNGCLRLQLPYVNLTSRQLSHPPGQLSTQLVDTFHRLQSLVPAAGRGVMLALVLQ